MQSIVKGGMKEKVFDIILANNGIMKEVDIIDELWFNGDSTGVSAKEFKKAKNNLASQITYLRKALKDHHGQVLKSNGKYKIIFETPMIPEPRKKLKEGEVECTGCGIHFETSEIEEDPHCLDCVNKIMLELGISFV